MLRDEDLQVAVAEGIVTEAQAQSLRGLARRRETQLAAELGHEERFRFMRGFNDFFFAVGIALFAGGLGFFALPTPAGSLIAAVLTWFLAELLVGRLRLVLPGILLAGIFVLFAVAASPVDLWFTTRGQGFDFAALQNWFTSTRFSRRVSYIDEIATSAFSVYIVFIFYALIGACAGLLFYARFRLPFALLVIAACLVSAVLAGVYHIWSGPAHQQLWTLPPPHIRALTLLACGILTFAAAMAFDLSDRERLTRRADCAFWLHLLAAPLIVHSLITLVAPDYQTAMTLTVALAILAIFAMLTVVAIVIDRRALLVSALIYVGIVIAYGIRTTSAVGQRPDDQSFVLFATLLVLGALVLMIGVGWRPLRRLFVRLLPAALGRRLPPTSASTPIAMAPSTQKGA
jgi:hypothetical protein